MAKVLCVLYDDPVGGHPDSYPRDDIPKIERYPDGQTTPTPEQIDFTTGALLGSVSGELGLRGFLEQRGHEFLVTSDKDGRDSVFERELAQQAEAAYRRTVADWRTTQAKRKGAGATPGRASGGPSSGQAARQDEAPTPAL